MLSLKKLLLIGLALALLAPAVQAERFSFAGGGGPLIGFATPDWGFVNDQTARFTPGFKKMDGALVMFGGFGYGEVAPNFKLGGYGFGGAKQVSGTFTAPSQPGVRIRQDVTVNIGGGGLYTEYEAFHFADRFEVATGIGIGFGATDLRIDQIGPNVRWDDLWGSLNPDSLASRNTFAIEMSRGFFMLHPEVGLKFFITDFMALDARAGYLLLVNMSDWQYLDAKVLDAPDNDMSAPTFGLRLVFGG